MALLAPGKLFLAGEYAVTLGEPALIAAVPPWGKAIAGSHSASPSPPTFQGRYPGAPTAPADAGWIVDTSDFFAAGIKLGFGSSATAAVLQCACERPPEGAATFWQRALERHEALTGKGGSGGDLAACIHGGVGLFQRHGDSYSWTPVAFPERASLAVVATASAADTRVWVQRFRGAATGDPALATWRQQLRACVQAFAKPGADWHQGLTEAAALYRELTQWLGPELYPEIFQICSGIANSLGLPFKPSGAGGGDIGFFFCPDSTGLQMLRETLRTHGLYERVVRPTTLGLHQEGTGTNP